MRGEELQASFLVHNIRLAQLVFSVLNKCFCSRLEKKTAYSDTHSHYLSQMSWGTMDKSYWSFPLTRDRKSVCVCKGVVLLSELPNVTLTHFSELNVCHSTFGICFQKDLDVGCGDVSLLVLVPAHSCPAVSFVLFYDVQQLALRHGDGALVMTCERRGRKNKREDEIRGWIDRWWMFILRTWRNYFCLFCQISLPECVRKSWPLW